MSKTAYSKLLRYLKKPGTRVIHPWNDMHPEWHDPPEQWPWMGRAPESILTSTRGWYKNARFAMWSIDFRHGRFFELEVIIPYWWTKGIGNITGSRVYTGTRWRQNGVTPEEALLWWKKVQCRIAIKDWHDADLTDCSWNEKKG